MAAGPAFPERPDTIPGESSRIIIAYIGYVPIDIRYFFSFFSGLEKSYTLSFSLSSPKSFRAISSRYSGSFWSRSSSAVSFSFCDRNLSVSAWSSFNWERSLMSETTP